MGKEPKHTSSKDKADVKEYVEVPAELLSPIAKPLAGKRPAKHVLKLVKRASKSRHLKRGVKEVVKSLRKGEKGIIVLAADISPMDILTHLPVLAEDAGCPYVWVNSKEYLGAAASTKRPTSCVMIAQARARRKTETQDAKTQQDETEFQSTFSDVHKEVSDLNETVVY